MRVIFSIKAFTIRFCLIIFVLFSLQAKADMADLIDAAMQGDHRLAKHTARDQFRNPKETLMFFGLEKDMTVVEIWPGMGWYSEILSPVLRDEGILYIASFSNSADRSPKWKKGMHKDFMEKLEKNPEVYDHVVVTELSVPERTTIAPPGTVDMLLTFRNVHNWMKGGYAKEMFKVFNRTLKPGGILGIVEHRAKPGTSLQEMVKSGYVTEEHVIQLAQQSGFEFVGKSEVNANAQDSAKHPEGVWTLPPSLRFCKKIKADDKRSACIEKYKAIGESDRMTLKFQKQ